MDDKIEIGERVVSLDEEDDGATGEVIGLSLNRLRIKWDDGCETWSTRRDGVRREDPNLTLDQVNGFELAALTAAIPPDLEPHFEAVCAAARRDVMLRLSTAGGQLAADARAEFARTGDEMVERDEAAGFATILLRDAIMKAGRAATVAAFDDVAIRRHFLAEVAALTETAMLALPDGAIDSWSHTDLIGAIGVVHIEAAACRVIARHEDARASWLKALGDSLSAPD